MSSGKLTSGTGKFVLSFVRTFPELVMALLFIKAVGPGSFCRCSSFRVTLYWNVREIIFRRN